MESTFNAPAKGDAKATAKRVYGTIPLKSKTGTSRVQSATPRARRSGAELFKLREQIADILRAENPMTVRQVFYRATTMGLIPKTEAAYKGTICGLLKKMRLTREIPFSWIADNTRAMRKPVTHKGLHNFLDRMAVNYRRDLWEDAPVYVEIWLEKDALSGVLIQATRPYDVPLMVTRGYPSISFLHSAAETIAAKGKPTFIYYFGDFDPSGVDISRAVEKGIREFAPEAEIHFERVAVNQEQIALWNLPTRPTKKSDGRKKGFDRAYGDGAESVEVDAIPSRQLRELATECIERHIDRHALAAIQATEQAERNTLREMGKGWKAGTLFGESLQP